MSQEKMETPNGLPGQIDKGSIKKIRRERQKLLIIKLFFDFAKNTTLHGLRYITEKGVSLVEKVFWFTTFSMSVALCFFLISKVWMKWQTYPVMVSFSEQMVPVSKVPFPSVTVCPQSKCLRSKYNFTDEWIKYYGLNNTNYNNEDPDYLAATRMLDDINILCITHQIQNLLPYQDTLLDSSLIHHIEQVSPTVEETFHTCKWRGSDVECGSFFNKVLTAEGVCYNFNSLAADEIFDTGSIQKDYSYLDTNMKSNGWNVLDGYTSDHSDNQYPFRGGENGAEPDLEVELWQKISDRDMACNSVNKGYKIYLHHPADLPHSSLYYYAALAGQLSSLALKFDMVFTSDNLKGYDPQIRQCYYPSDRRLRYFREYTENNCMLECQANLTYEGCGCVWFNMPHNNSQEICTINQIQCMKTAKASITTLGLGKTCQCLPLCNNIKYDAEILKTDFNKKASISVLDIVYGNNDKDEDENIDDIEYSKIEIYFKEPTFVSTRRSELFGLTDFLANCGGLLGLFLGFSFLSLAEIFYFLTLRLMCTIKKDLRQERKSLTSTSTC